MDWLDAKDLIIEFLAGTGVLWLGSEIHKMRSSVETLNIRMAELLQITTFHSTQLDRHEDRLGHLENRK